jgi:hypothetical protein
LALLHGRRIPGLSAESASQVALTPRLSSKLKYTDAGTGLPALGVKVMNGERLYELGEMGAGQGACLGVRAGRADDNTERAKMIVLVDNIMNDVGYVITRICCFVTM